MRMGDPAPESLGPLEVRQVALVVGEVAAADPDEPAGQMDALAGVGALDLDRPVRLAEDHSIGRRGDGSGDPAVTALLQQDAELYARTVIYILMLPHTCETLRTRRAGSRVAGAGMRGFCA